jgi:3-oxoacyl-[acyl-carrier protein] reductase
VTGSSRGIGAAIAKLYAQQGAKVAVHARDGAALASLVDAHPVKRLGTPEDVAQAGSFPRVRRGWLDHRRGAGRHRSGNGEMSSGV